MSKKPSPRRTITKSQTRPAKRRATTQSQLTRSQSAAAAREASEKFHAFVFDHGQVYNSYLATEPGRELFWLENERGVISYVRRGRHVFSGGGLIARPEDREELLQEFLHFTREFSLRPVFFDIQDDVVDLFRNRGFKATKIGEDALVDLQACTFAGKPYEWIRRQSNYCRRHGLVTSEVRKEQLTPDDWSMILAEIQEVAEASISDKPQSQEMRFVVGRLGDHELGQRRLFIARRDHGQGRIEGFVVLNPMNGGTRWATEIYRYRPDAVRGTIAFVIHQLMEQLKAEGVRQVSLCMIPGRNCE